jgi:DNA-binding PadR family transcriptional regulator
VKEMPESTERGALTEAVFYILLALHKPTHGYGIMKFIKEISNERVVLGSGTLYGAVTTLLKKDWIKVLTTASNENKKEYLITEQGRLVVKNEIDRLKELISHASNVIGGDQNDA